VVFVEASSTSQVSAVCRLVIVGLAYRAVLGVCFAPPAALYAAVAGGARWVLNIDVCGLGFSCPHAHPLIGQAAPLEPDGTLTLLQFEFANVMEATTNDHYRLCKHLKYGIW